MEQFAKDITIFTEVNIEHALNTITNNESAIYFIGRATCPYCRRFATKLSNVVRNTNTVVYFINSEKNGQEKQLANFRSKYNIPTVPGFVKITSGHTEVRCDSSLSENEITDFMNK